MILRFFSGSVTPASFVKKALCGVHSDNVEPELFAHVLLHFLELVLAQHAVVHEDARQSSPMADATARRRRTNPRRRTARRSHVLSPTCLRIAATVSSMKCAASNSALRRRCRRQSFAAAPCPAACDALRDETAPPRCARSFSIAATAFGLRDQVKPRGSPRLRRRATSRRSASAAVPGTAASQRQFNLGMAVLALVAGHLAAEIMRDELQAVADAEHRHAQRSTRASAAGASAS